MIVRIFSTHDHFHPSPVKLIYLSFEYIYTRVAYHFQKEWVDTQSDSNIIWSPVMYKKENKLFLKKGAGPRIVITTTVCSHVRPTLMLQGS